MLLPDPLPRSPCSPPPPRPIPPSRPPPLPPPPGPQGPAAVSQSQSSVGAPKNVVARGRSRRSRAGHTQRTIVRRSVGRHARRWDVVFCRRRRDTWERQRRSCRRRAARRPTLQPAPRAATAPDRSRSARSAVKGTGRGPDLRRVMAVTSLGTSGGRGVAAPICMQYPAAAHHGLPQRYKSVRWRPITRSSPRPAMELRGSLRCFTVLSLFLTWISYRCGTELTQLWHGAHSDVARSSLRCGTELTQMWHGVHSDVARSSLSCGTELTQMWHRAHSDVARS